MKTLAQLIDLAAQQAQQAVRAHVAAAKAQDHAKTQQAVLNGTLTDLRAKLSTTAV